MNRLKNPPIAGLLCAAFSLALLSCSETAPEIKFGFIELVYYEGGAGPEERFSFFVLPEDGDGVENLGELYLYHDKAGLRWEITSEDWALHEEEGRVWIGSRAIGMFDDESLPRGQYRAVLVNKGGERTERAFAFDAPEEARYPFPSLSVSGGNFRVDSRYPENQFVCYDAAGEYLQTARVFTESGAVAELGLADAVHSMALWARDPEYQCSAFTKPAVVR